MLGACLGDQAGVELSDASCVSASQVADKGADYYRAQAACLEAWGGMA